MLDRLRVKVKIQPEHRQMSVCTAEHTKHETALMPQDTRNYPRQYIPPCRRSLHDDIQAAIAVSPDPVLQDLLK
jgi:hypothetical protein